MDDFRFRKCPGCGKHRPVNDFRDDDLKKMGRFYKFCRDCGGSVVPEWPDEKECPVCGEVKPLADFKRTTGRGRSSSICNFCRDKRDEEKRQSGYMKKKKSKEEAIERWKRVRKAFQKKKTDKGQTCPVCGEFREYAIYRRQGVTKVTEETPCNMCIGTEAHSAWYAERLREYNRKKKREYRKKKKTS